MEPYVAELVSPLVFFFADIDPIGTVPAILVVTRTTKWRAGAGSA